MIKIFRLYSFCRKPDQGMQFEIIKADQFVGHVDIFCTEAQYVIKLIDFNSA